MEWVIIGAVGWVAIACLMVAICRVAGQADREQSVAAAVESLSRIRSSGGMPFFPTRRSPWELITAVRELGHLPRLPYRS